MNAKRVAFGLQVALCVALVAGAVGVVAYRTTDRKFRTELLQKARMTALSLNLSQATALTGTEADFASPDYQRIKEKLILMRGVNPRCRFLYLMSRRSDGAIILHVDSEPADSEDYSPPGQTYDEAPSELQSVFSGGQARVTGPYKDRWGRWFSAFVPLSDSQAGDMRMVFGVDIDASDWQGRVAFSVAVSTAITALTLVLGILIIVLLRRSRSIRDQQQSLLKSEDRYRSLVDNLSAGMVVCGPDTAILFSNAAAVSLLGLSEDPLSGKLAMDPLWCFLQEDGLPLPVEKYPVNQVIRSGKVYHNQIIGVSRPDRAEPVWLLCNAYPVKNEAGQIMQAVLTFVDITQRKQSEKQVAALLEESNQARSALLGIIEDEAQGRVALRESETRMELVLEGSELGSWDWDVITGNLIVNERWLGMLGYSLDEVEPSLELWEKWIHPDDLQGVQAVLQEHVEGRADSYEAEFRMQHTSGHWVWILDAGHVIERTADGKALRVCGTQRDITARKQAEQEKGRLMAAIEQSAETIVITDADAKIEYVNPAFEKVTGYTSEEAIGHNPRVLQSGEHDEEFYRAMWEALLRGETWKGQVVNKKKSGEFYTEEATISPVCDEAGRTVNYVAVKRDVTEEIIREEQFRQAQKMQSIGQLVAGIAHDFNNLLQVINGYADIAHAQLPPKHAADESIGQIALAGGQAKTLVKQLLAFSRQQVIDPVDFDLNELIRNSWKMLRHMIGEHIQFEFVAGDDLGTVFVDKGQMQQVLMNLCVNARDAMPGGGTLSVQTEHIAIGPDDLKTHMWARPGHYVQLNISDTGCGMEKETCDRIFEPFFTTKEVGKGTGLGLSTVYGIVKQNEGTIKVSSDLGAGTTFTIYLPVNEPLLEEIVSASSENNPPIEDGIETILVVEDETVVLELTTQILSTAGYTVLTAKDGEDAMRAVEEHADEIDCVMMDVVMPRMGGKDAMEKILEKRPAMRHLFVSGYSHTEGHTDFIKDMGHDLLSKPYLATDLLRKIREVLDR